MSLALHHGGLVPRELLAVKSLLAIDVRYVNNGKELVIFDRCIAHVNWDNTTMF